MNWSQNRFTQEQDEKKCQYVRLLVYVHYMQANERDAQEHVVVTGACSLSAAGGSTGLVQPHGFAQPASKVYFLHFRSFDECVALKKGIEKNKTSHLSCS